MDVSHNALTRIFARSRIPRLYERSAIGPLDESLGMADGVLWTLIHVHYANMGGIAFEVEGQPFKPYALGPANGSTLLFVSLQRIYDIIKNRSKPTL